jgi:hypothetical protein
MATTFRTGDQLASTVCTTRVIVVRAPSDGIADLSCGGSPMVAAAGGRPAGAPAAGAVTLLGKRYVDANDTIEVLCTAAGTGELTLDGVALAVKAAKVLPASD